MSNKTWDEITYPSPNFNGCTVWDWTGYFAPILQWIQLLITRFPISKRWCIASKKYSWLESLDITSRIHNGAKHVLEYQYVSMFCCVSISFICNRVLIRSLQWRHNGLDWVSNHQPHHCLLSRLFGRRSKKTSKLRVTGLCVGNSPVTGEFPAQKASNAENVSIWWRHHGNRVLIRYMT